MSKLKPNRQATIRRLNDTLRRTMVTGKVVVTRAIADLSLSDQAKIVEAVRSFDNFERKNDPYREHDFGAFEAAGQHCFFKIDYYDAKMEFGSEDPADPAKTIRVLTIMLRSDY